MRDITSATFAQRARHVREQAGHANYLFRARPNSWVIARPRTTALKINRVQDIVRLVVSCELRAAGFRTIYQPLRDRATAIGCECRSVAVTHIEPLAPCVRPACIDQQRLERNSESTTRRQRRLQRYRQLKRQKLSATRSVLRLVGIRLINIGCRLHVSAGQQNRAQHCIFHCSLPIAGD
jgi:hypothetical protein